MAQLELRGYFYDARAQNSLQSYCGYLSMPLVWPNETWPVQPKVCRPTLQAVTTIGGVCSTNKEVESLKSTLSIRRLFSTGGYVSRSHGKLVRLPL